MKKRYLFCTLFLAFMFTIFSFVNIYAEEASSPSLRSSDVTSEEELSSALADPNITTINLSSDITTTKKINIMRDVTVNGNGNKIIFSGIDKNVWGSYYILQVYKANVTLNNITLTGGNVGLLVNGAEVTLSGTINVSDNGFGGIELSKGSGVATNPSIIFSSANIINTTETYKRPTLWTDPELTGIDVTYSFAANVNVVKGEYSQKQYYLEKDNSVDKADNQITNSTENVIDVVASSNDTISKEILNNLMNGSEKIVNIDVGNAIISFNTKNISKAFESDLSLNIKLTSDEKEYKDIENIDNANLFFIDLDYSGTLASGTKITFDVGNLYNAGSKVYLYYYNSKTGKPELVRKNLTVSADNKVTISIDHASVYFTSDKLLTEKTIKNPNTSDSMMLVIISLAVVGLTGIGFASKQKLFGLK